MRTSETAHQEALKMAHSPARSSTAARGRIAAAACAALAGILLAACPSAFALSGKPIRVGTPYESGAPSVAVTTTGEAVLAWANTKDLEGAKNFVQYCVVAPHGSGCAHSGNLVPADGAAYIDGVHVIVDGSTLVILADVFGAEKPVEEEFEPEQEWQSTDGGATWSIVDEGRSVADGILSADTVPNNAVIVPGTGVLGFGWQTAVDVPTFNAFPLESPTECSHAPGHCPAGFAKLEAESNPDVLSNSGGNFASQFGTEPGILAVFNTDFSNGPLGCSGVTNFGTAFVYGSGEQSGTNNYNIPFGKPNSAWKTELTQAACGVEYPVVGGGPSGFGVVERQESSGRTVYQHFNSATHTFSSPVEISHEGELDPSLSQDGIGGDYVTYLRGGFGGPIVLSYSATKGSGWTPTTILVHDQHGEIGEVSSNVGSNGQGWVTWTENGSVYVQQFSAGDALASAFVSAGSKGTDTRHTISPSLECTDLPCTVKVKVTIVVHGHHETIASGHVTLHSAGFHKFTMNLTHSGRSAVHEHKGRLTATVVMYASFPSIVFSEANSRSVHFARH